MYAAPVLTPETVAIKEAPEVIQPDSELSSTDSESTSFINESSAPIADIKSTWPAFLDVLLRDRPNLGSFLSLAYIAASTQDSIDLKFGPGYRFQYMEVTKKNNREEITQMLCTFLGAPIELRIALDTKAPESDEQNYIKQIGNIRSTIHDEIEKEPIIQTLLDLFDGEIIQ